MHPQPGSCRGHVDPIGPRTVYDEAERCAEALTTACRTAKGADTAVIRQAPAGRPLTVAGDGRQTRSARHVADLARGTLPPACPREHGPVNPGDPTGLTVRTVGWFRERRAPVLPARSEDR